MKATPFRSVLYMPATNERALEKAKSLTADALVIDLEDAVSEAAKDAARVRACAAAASGEYGHRFVVIRINGLDTPWGQADLDAALAAAPDAILAPKVSHAAQARRLSDAIGERGHSKTRLWLMVETAMAIINISEIAATARDNESRLSCLMMGTNDIAKETGASLANERQAVVPWLSQCVVAAKAYGLGIIDAVLNDFHDLKALETECIQGRNLGMDGKSLIHPKQIDAANRIFSPSESTIAWAREVTSAFDQPENADVNVLSIDGVMVERLHLDIARRIISASERLKSD